MKLSHLLLGAFIVGLTTAIATEIVERVAFKKFGPKA